MIIYSVVYWQVPSIQLLFGMLVVIISLYLFYTEQRGTYNFEENGEELKSYPKLHKGEIDPHRDEDLKSEL